MEISQTAKVVLEKRYLLKNEKGEVIETPEGMLKRVANAIASAEEKYGGDVKKWAKKFYEIMDRQEFMPNSPTLMNAGTPLGQLSACFVIPVEDSIDGIFKALWDMARVQKSGGGTGFSFSRLRPKGDIVKSTMGVACFTGDTRILTNDGFIKIEELIRNGNSPLIATHEGFKRLVEKYDNGKAKVFRIVTEDGYELKVTEDHKFLVFDESGNPVLKPLKKLKEGDFIYILTPSEFDKDYIKLNTNVECNGIEVKLPEVLDERLAYLIGLIFADGHISYRYANGKLKSSRIEIYLNSKESEVKEKVKKISKELFGIEPNEYVKDNKVTFVIPSTKVVKFLELNDLIKDRSENIRVPEHIFRSKPSVIAAFISGFFDGDGSLDRHYRISMKSVSEGFIKDVQILLTALGIVARIQEYEPKDSKKVYTLRIQTKDMKLRAFEKLKESVKLSSIRGEAINYLKENGKNRKYSIPFNVIYKIKKPETRAKIQRDYKLLSYNSKKTHREFITKILQFAEDLGLDEDEIRYFRMLSVLYPNRIVRIDPIGIERVYDIQVEGVHLLTGNCIYTSNSGPVSFMKIFDAATEQIKQGGKRRGANMGVLNVHHPDIEEFITAKWEEGVLRNFNISVAVTDKFMEALLNDTDYELINPRTNEVVKKIKAKRIFNLIVEGAWRNGEPGIVFIDEINRHNPTPHLGKIESTNPCVTADTWIMTKEGARQVKDLIGRKFVVILNGKEYESDPRGFFFTGIKKVLRLRTKEGFELRLTEDHPVLRVVDGKVEWCRAGKLRKGDKLVLNRNRGVRWKGRYNERDGYILATSLRNGRLNRKATKTRMRYASRIRIPDGISRCKGRNMEEIEKASFDFYIGFIRGLFESNCKMDRIKLTHQNPELLKVLQRMLLRLGIFSRINGNELVISDNSVTEFCNIIGFGIKNKANQISDGADEFTATVEEIVEDGLADVYDASIPGINAFDANGFIVHNCGEQPLLPYESCNLGSINLARFVNEEKRDFEWDRLREVVWIATRFLDDVIDVNAYPIPEIEEMTKKTRKIGLGVMGWADALFKLNIAYDSDDALKLAEKVMKFIRDESYKASQQLAEERGVFPAWEGSVWEKRGIRIRNATTTTIAPTGTISIIANCSSGIEPIFALAYKRKNILDGEEFFEVNPIFEERLKEIGMFSEEILSKIAEEGSIQEIEEIPEEIKRVFKCALDIAPDWHVRMQAAFQKYTDNAVSKTINLPNNASKADVAKAFLLAYELKCKGITVYRDGSREEQVLAIKKTEKKKEKEEEKVKPPLRYHKPRPRPKITKGVTIETKTGCGSLYVTINEDEHGIAEVFVQLGKSGGCAASQTEAIGRLLSIALRSWVDPEALIKQLKGIRCPSIGFDNGEIITSCADGVAKALEKHLKGEYKRIKVEVKGVKPLTEFVEGVEEKKKERTKMIGGVCPECGNILEYGEGCMTCKMCGFTRCG